MSVIKLLVFLSNIYGIKSLKMDWCVSPVFKDESGLYFITLYLGSFNIKLMLGVFLIAYLHLIRKFLLQFS